MIEVGHVECVDVRESSRAVSAAKNDDLVVVEDGGVGAPTGGLRAERGGSRPSKRDGVEEVRVVVVRWSVAATDDEYALVDQDGRMRARDRWDLARHFRFAPVESLCVFKMRHGSQRETTTKGRTDVELPDVAEALAADVAATKAPNVAPDHGRAVCAHSSR